MNRKEYETKKRLLQDELESLKEEFIQEHKPCEIGAIIEIDSIYYKKKVRGICVGFTTDIHSSNYCIDKDNKVGALFKKLKKDGTASGDNLYVWKDEINLVRFIH